MWEELEEAKTKEQRQSLGNIKLMCELFKLKMLTEHVMHDVIVRLLKNQHDNSLEGLCTLLYTIGKDLDMEKARVQHFVCPSIRLFVFEQNKNILFFIHDSKINGIASMAFLFHILGLINPIDSDL